MRCSLSRYRSLFPFSVYPPRQCLLRNRRLLSSGAQSDPTKENLNVEHASEISSESSKATPSLYESTKDSGDNLIENLRRGQQVEDRDLKDVGNKLDDGALRGRLLPTATHLFKLVLPLPERPFSGRSSNSAKPDSQPPTIFLLHPSQPLSHISRLITASFPFSSPQITFRSSFSPPSGSKFASQSSSGKGIGSGSGAPLAQGGGRNDPIVTRTRLSGSGDANSGGLNWSDSTDIGDFVREAALDTEFIVMIKPEPSSSSARQTSVVEASPGEEGEGKNTKESITIRVAVPSFGDRTQFLRARLAKVSSQVTEMEALKKECDNLAHRGAKRLALSGFGVLVIYWAGVARLTFWDVGWDIMEPVTYLSGLTTVMCGYLWFLYQGREVSYTTVLSTSISSRRHALYASRGFNLQRWMDLTEEQKALRREISKIAVDYDVSWKEGEKLKEEEEGDLDEKNKRAVDDKDAEPREAADVSKAVRETTAT